MAAQPQKKATIGLKFRILNFRKKRNCTIYVAKIKWLISCLITVQLICAFVFPYAKSRFSHDVAQVRATSEPPPKNSQQHKPQPVSVCVWGGIWILYHKAHLPSLDNFSVFMLPIA